jgi:hypothetical protein
VDEDIDYEIGEDGQSEHEFIEFVTKLSERSRARQLREQIERREESKRIRDFLGIDGFELKASY